MLADLRYRQKDTLSHYLTAARMIPMRIELWSNLERVFFAGIAEEDETIEKYVIIFLFLEYAH